MSTTLIRLDSSNDPLAGGFAITFPSGKTKAIAWQSSAPITPPLDAAKQYAARSLQTCIDEQRTDDAERTNWASVVAAVQAIILEFNEARRAALYAERPPVDNVH